MTLAPGADPGHADAVSDTERGQRVKARMRGTIHHVATLDIDAPASLEESTPFVRRVTGP